MEVGKVNSISCSKVASKRASSPHRNYVSFKAKAPSDVTKRGWFYLRRMGDKMKDITEVKNAWIAAVGTGIIAPAVIMVSPGKGDKKDKDKKFLQALRQPISAFLALGFQLPTTMMLDKFLDGQAYDASKKFHKYLRDDKLGDLIPSEDYFKKHVKAEEFAAKEEIFDKVIDGKSLKQELEMKIKTDYKEVGLDVSDEELAKLVEKEKKGFLTKKIAKENFDKFKKEKIRDILTSPEKYPELDKIKDIDLVNEDYRELAKHRFKAGYDKLESEAGLSIFDKALREMGIETPKVKALSDRQKAFCKEEGLKILKEDKPEIFNNKAKRIENFVEAYRKDADKYFKNKKFWVTLGVNLFMVAISCYVLNWIHPRVNSFIESRKEAKKDAKEVKVEVA